LPSFNNTHYEMAEQDNSFIK